MTELAFAKQFLSALDARPMRISPDHVVDPREYPAQPAFTLPKPPSGPRLKRARPTANDTPGSSSPAAASATAGTTVTLKPTRPSPSTPALTLPTPQPPHTSIHALKTAYATASGLPVDKIKLLYKKKPVGDTKTLKDVLGDTEAASEAEFSVMVMGGAAAAAAASSPAGTPERVTSPGVSTPSAAAEGPLAQPVQSGEQVAESNRFWSDLEGFLAQRVKDEAVAKRMTGVFRSAWEKETR
ncbi:cell-cycle control medial ring component [Phyllosticta capitalensis]|uniref:Cell-cycle control medial ring component n=1 Tax=Phyllosticta capitalensis TaxID=121624 RepID=A0ABR1Z416_9PEZI